MLHQLLQNDAIYALLMTMFVLWFGYLLDIAIRFLGFPDPAEETGEEGEA